MADEQHIKQGGDAALVELNDVSYSVGGRVILDRISLDLRARRVGIIGRNGSGKTTLARLICGLVAANSGAVRVNGVDVAKDRRQAISTVGLIFQNPDHQIIFPTVEEEMAFGLQNQGHSKAQARARARAALAAFGKLPWAEASVSVLSQGQRHLVCLMAVMAMAPDVVVLDEPFTGLDIPTSRQLHRQLDRAAPSLIHITHDPESLRAYDRVVWIDQGGVEMDGSPDVVLPKYIETMEQIGRHDVITDLSG